MKKQIEKAFGKFENTPFEDIDKLEVFACIPDKEARECAFALFKAGYLTRSKTIILNEINMNCLNCGKDLHKDIINNKIRIHLCERCRLEYVDGQKAKKKEEKVRLSYWALQKGEKRRIEKWAKAKEEKKG